METRHTQHGLILFVSSLLSHRDNKSYIGRRRLLHDSIRIEQQIIDIHRTLSTAELFAKLNNEIAPNTSLKNNGYQIKQITHINDNETFALIFRQLYSPNELRTFLLASQRS